ncbi:MAG: serine hydrolase [Rhizobiaceae bacterium]
MVNSISTVRVRTARQTAFFTSFAVCALAMIAVLTTVAPSKADANLPSIVIDRQSGAVLSQNRAFDRWYPASLTKLMTVYVTLRAIEAGELASGSPVTMSKLAAAQPPSRMGLKPGTQLRVDMALRILVVKSANDVAIALAESVAGSVPAFVERMNAEARRLGLGDTNFVNPNGLHAEDQFTSARDIALLARRILVEFPAFADTFSVPAIRFGQEVDYSYNLLLERFSGADGMKTGFVCASGYNMVASATRNGRQIIAVVFGAFSQTDRAVDAARLLLAGFEQSGGTPVEALTRQGGPIRASSQRGTVCSKKAYETRYDPAGGDARINSPLLEPRKVARQPLEVRAGGVDAPPSEAALTVKLVPRGRIPVPSPKPVRVNVDGEPLSWSEPLRGSAPLPVPRPMR